jgi:hypothetical protein
MDSHSNRGEIAGAHFDEDCANPLSSQQLASSPQHAGLHSFNINLQKVDGLHTLCGAVLIKSCRGDSLAPL